MGSEALRLSQLAKVIPKGVENAKMRRGVSCQFIFYIVV
jgi:hypothetical protein